jgi:hypothetical protein
MPKGHSQHVAAFPLKGMPQCASINNGLVLTNHGPEVDSQLISQWSAIILHSLIAVAFGGVGLHSGVSWQKPPVHQPAHSMICNLVMAAQHMKHNGPSHGAVCQIAPFGGFELPFTHPPSRAMDVRCSEVLVSATLHKQALTHGRWDEFSGCRGDFPHGGILRVFSRWWNVNSSADTLHAKLRQRAALPSILEARWSPAQNTHHASHCEAP